VLLAGPAVLSDLARALRRPRFTVWSDLTFLEEEGVVVTEWQPRDGWPAGARAYRLPNFGERETRDAEEDAFDNWLRAALHAAAEALYPDDGSPQ
jgi:predicted ArsR family transcriptional regulator